MWNERLSTYLNDHLAGAGFALELLDHLISEAPESSDGLPALRSEILEDREQLRALMASHHIDESRVRKAGARIAEWLAEVKLEADDEDRGPLRRLERLEALAIGIEGKIALWGALEAAARSNAGLPELNYQGLTQRGRDQRSRVETLRLQAAIAALAD